MLVRYCICFYIESKNNFTYVPMYVHTYMYFLILWYGNGNWFFSKLYSLTVSIMSRSLPSTIRCSTVIRTYSLVRIWLFPNPERIRKYVGVNCDRWINPKTSIHKYVHIFRTTRGTNDTLSFIVHTGTVPYNILLSIFYDMYKYWIYGNCQWMWVY